MRARLLALIFLACSCDALNGRATGPKYQGEPLATVTGRMTAARDLALQGDVRLALAWFTSGDLAAQTPDAVHTESVIYEPVFPAGFSVGLYDLPALKGTGVSGPAGVRAGAVGIFMAYDDRNRNGALDTYRAGTVPVDSVLGTSLGSLGPTPDPDGFFLVLLDQPSPPGSVPALKRGLNLVRMTGEVLGFDHPVAIHLDGALEWNLFICDQLFNLDRRAACLDGLRPDAGGPDGGGDAGVQLAVSGSIGVSNNLPNASVSITLNGSNRPDASVDLNGVALGWDAPSAQFRLATGASASAVLPGADNALHVNTGDLAPLTLNFPMPANFAITAPTFNATLTSGAPFDVAWAPVADGGTYRVMVFRATPFSTVFDQQNVLGSPFTVPGVAYQGSATVTVEASLPGLTGPGGAFLYRYVNQSIPVKLQ